MGDLLGDLDGDRLEGTDGEKSGILIFSLASLLDFFLGEVLEKKAGRTMEMDDAAGSHLKLKGLCEWSYPCITVR